jgi:hypothetical protein
VRGKLEIDPEGRAELDGASAERLRGRRYALVPTPPELLVGVARDRDSGSADAVVLTGDLQRVPFPEVVSLLAHTKQSGLLRIVNGAATRTVIFCDGEVRGASSEHVGEHLGETAVRLGLLKREQAESLREHVHEGRRAGRLAVEKGLLSERDLWKAIQEHVTTIFQGILLEARGTFVFTNELVDEAVTVPGLSPDALLMEGVRRLDELRAAAGGDRSPERVLAAFNRAFRDIFSTFEESGRGDALRRAVASVFDEDLPDVRPFRGLGFTSAGELPVDEALERAARAAAELGVGVAEILSGVLSNALLFLLFVAGEHLEPNAHRSLHARVKSLV